MAWITLIEVDWARCSWIRLDVFETKAEAWDSKLDLEGLGFRVDVLWSDYAQVRKGESNEDQG